MKNERVTIKIPTIKLPKINWNNKITSRLLMGFGGIGSGMGVINFGGSSIFFLIFGLAAITAGFGHLISIILDSDIDNGIS